VGMKDTQMNSNLRHFRPGQYLFREGDPSSSLYLIKRGSVAVRKMKGANYIELGKVYSSEVLGELSFFDRKARSASAVAITEVDALEIDFESLDKVYDKVPPYLKTIIASVAERLRKANDQIRRLQKSTVTREGVETDENAVEERMDAASILEATAGIGMDLPADEDTKTED
jgi:CRP/FNR family cyclic AMP-dependent transcriptional regulator